MRPSTTRTHAHTRESISTPPMRVVHHASRASRRHPSASSSSIVHDVASDPPSIGRIHIRPLSSRAHAPLVLVSSARTTTKARPVRRERFTRVVGVDARIVGVIALIVGVLVIGKEGSRRRVRVEIEIGSRIDRSMGRSITHRPIDRPNHRSITHRSTDPSIDPSITHRSTHRVGGTRSWVVFGGLDVEGRHSSGVCVPSSPARARVAGRRRASRRDDAGRDEGGDDRGWDHARGARVT